MFRFFDKESRLEKNEHDRRFDAHMAQMEAQEKLFNLARDCKECQDIGVIAVAVRSLNDPHDQLFIEYMRCSCGCSIHPNVSELLKQY